MPRAGFFPARYSYTQARGWPGLFYEPYRTGVPPVHPPATAPRPTREPPRAVMLHGPPGAGSSIFFLEGGSNPAPAASPGCRYLGGATVIFRSFADIPHFFLIALATWLASPRVGKGPAHTWYDGGLPRCWRI